MHFSISYLRLRGVDYTWDKGKGKCGVLKGNTTKFQAAIFFQKLFWPKNSL